MSLLEAEMAEEDEELEYVVTLCTFLGISFLTYSLLIYRAEFARKMESKPPREISVPDDL